MNKSHESEKLNALLGKRVKVVFFDDSTQTGVLERGKYHCPYLINNIEFYKSHIKKITEVF